VARVVRAPTVRRAELLEAAHALFLERGYDATSIQDIMVRAGISKGGFYHHFASKEDMLAALVEQLTSDIVVRLEPILTDKKINALVRLNRVMAAGTELKAESAPAVRYVAGALMRQENAYLHQRLQASTFEVLQPIMRDIISEGVAQGIFSTSDPALVAEIHLGMTPGRQAVLGEALRALDRHDLKTATQLVEGRMHAEERVLERLLGLPPSSVQLFEPKALRRLLKNLASA
jgi:AcrR family transcriptional regulator